MSKAKEALEQQIKKRASFFAAWGDLLEKPQLEALTAKLKEENPTWLTKQEGLQVTGALFEDIDATVADALQDSQADRRRTFQAEEKRIKAAQQEERKRLTRFEKALGLDKPKEPVKPMTPGDKALVEQEFSLFGTFKPANRARAVLNYLKVNNPLPPVPPKKRRQSNH